ncbi:MAG: DinB family protein [Chloroflexota bacterium]
MIETHALNQLLLEAFSGKITWLEASTKYPLDEFIASFHRTREVMQKTLVGLTDAQVAYIIPREPMWSISEMVTHLIYSQNFYYNQLLDITTSELPHLLEAAQGFGEGAKANLPADVLREQLNNATALIKVAIEKTQSTHKLEAIRDSTLFGKVNYPTWILLLLGHEIDHVRQGIIMRRAARTTIRS